MIRTNVYVIHRPVVFNVTFTVDISSLMQVLESWKKWSETPATSLS